MINILKVLYKKEVLDASRDKRSVMAGLYYAIGTPILFCALITVMLNQLLSPDALHIKIDNGQLAPNLVEYLKENDVIHSDDKEKLKAITLLIDDNYQQDMSEGRVATITLIADKSDQKLSKHTVKVERLIARYSSEIAGLRLIARGINPSLMQPVALQVEDQATPESKGGMMLGVATLSIILTLFYAAMALAIDTSAGERERNSLALLLSHPVSSFHVVLSKVLAISTFSMLGLVIILIVSKVSYGLVPWEQLGFSINITFEFMVFTTLVGFPIALMSASLQVFVSFMAKSFKEAQSYVTMVLFVPMMLSMVVAYDIAADVVQWFPIAAQQFALMEFIKGNDIPYTQLVMSSIITLVLFAIFSYLSSRMLKSEKVVFGL